MAPRIPRIMLRNTAIVAAVIALLYTLAGFLLIPWIAKRELPRYADAQLQRNARVGDIAFNPYTLTLRVRDFAVTEKDGRTMFGLRAAVVALEWRSLLRRAWMLSELRLTEPTVRFEISREGQINLAALAPKASADAAQSGPPRFAIGHFAIENGSIDFEDQREGYQNRFERLSFELSSLSTLEADKGLHTLAAITKHGASLRWKGELTLAPLIATGTLEFKNVPLLQFNPYLDDYVAAKFSSGEASLELHYRFALAAGKPQLHIHDSQLAVRELEMTANGMPFAKFGEISAAGVTLDLQAQRAAVQALRVANVTLAARRNAAGELDLDRMLAPTRSGAARPAGESAAWQATIDEVKLDNVSASYTDETAKVPVAVSARGLRSTFRLDAESGAQGTRIRADAREIGLEEIFAGPASREQPALRLAQISVTGTRFDSGSNTLDIDAARAAGFSVDAALEDGRLTLLDLIPAASDAKPGKPLVARAKSIELAGGSASYTDRANALTFALERLAAKLANVSSDTTKPLAFEASGGIQSGGTLSARGSVVPATGVLESRVEATGVSLTKLQPLVAQFANVKLTSGTAAIAGQVRAGNQQAKLSYSGSAALSDVAIQDDTGAPLLAWKSLAAGALNLTLAPHALQIDELRWHAPTSKLAIATDRTTNIGRVLKRSNPAPAPDPPPAERKIVPVADDKPDEAGNFAVAIRRVRIEQGALDFSDDSLRPGFAADIRGLDGTLNNVSSDRSTRSQLSLEGSVGEFGYARLTGALNAMAPHEFATLRMQLRNLDATKISPYAIRFAGYRIASGRISLDLNYRLRDKLIEGDNQIVLDQFALGERVESPGALDLPLELAIALLKDADGRIDVAVPVAGNLDDPKFDYGALVSKAIGNLILNIVAAPFRLLAKLFGGTEEQLGVIAFDPGASRLLPPEREKLGRLVAALNKRPELKLVIPGRYDSTADAAALKRAALRREVGKRAGFTVERDDASSPMNIEDRPTREALRTLFAERFSPAELERLKSEAETKARAAGADGAKPQQPTAIEKLRNFARGEPQVTDARDFYRTLLRRLLDAQPLAAEALPELAQKRATTIAEALAAAGVDPARITQTQAEPTSSNAGAREVTLQLSLSVAR